MKRIHPDVNEGFNIDNQTLTMINESYKTLANPIRRIQYDNDINYK